MSKVNGEKFILIMGKKRGYEGYEDKVIICFLFYLKIEICFGIIMLY